MVDAGAHANDESQNEDWHLEVVIVNLLQGLYVV
jgi:hypothetical protein